MEEFIEQQKMEPGKESYSRQKQTKAIDRMDKIDKPKDLPQK